MPSKKVFLTLVLVILIITFGWTRIKKSVTEVNTNQPPSMPQTDQSSSPQIISTKPDSLINTDYTIVSADEIIEITFNRSLENEGEFKVRIEPKMDFKIEMANGRKSAKIIPLRPYDLGSTYTLFIGPETKFDGVGRWGQEKIFHFRTIKYTGV